MFQHYTPGPWVVLGGNIRRVSDAGDTTESVPLDNLANARLIAAAPGLVNALQDVLTVLQNAATTAHHAYCGDANVYCVTCEARCALARVKKFVDKSEVQS